MIDWIDAYEGRTEIIYGSLPGWMLERKGMQRTIVGARSSCTSDGTRLTL